MNTILEYLSGPALGAVIGYITNDIAIRMLFRPRKAKYIMGVHVPFTPGIIPKEKDRIAQAIGNTISENLMNKDVLEKTLLSDEMLEKVRDAVNTFFNSQIHNEETLEQFAAHFLTEQEINDMRSSTCDEVAKLITSKLRDKSIGHTIARAATEHVVEKTRDSLAGKIKADRLVEIIAAPIQDKMAQHINQVLAEQAPVMASKIVENEGDKLLRTRMCDLFMGHEQQLQQAENGIVNVYRTIISNHLPRILQSINISSIVEKRIKEMDMAEAEEIIISVMNKELRAIVWFGALLGAVMGVVMTVINV